jgi:uncharacterized membrane protein YtjA (UPF0391 family)
LPFSPWGLPVCSGGGFAHLFQHDAGDDRDRGFEFAGGSKNPFDSVGRDFRLAVGRARALVFLNKVFVTALVARDSPSARSYPQLARGLLLPHQADFVRHFVNLLEVTMLRWALIFFIVAIVAALFGFGGIAAGAIGIARILFFIFLVLFVISLLYGLMSGRPPMGPPV